MPAPQVKSNEIMQRADSLQKGVGTGEFVFRQIHREIEKVKEVYPAEGYMLEGIIYSKALDYERSTYAHKLSVQLEPSEANIWNYAASMSNMAYYRDVSSIYDMLLDSGVASLEQIASSLHISLILSDVERFFYIYNKYAVPKLREDRFGEKSLGNDIDVFRVHAESLRNFLLEEDISQEDLSRIASHVLDILESRNDDSVSVTIQKAEFYGSKLMHLVYFLKGSADYVHDMNMELMERIVDDEAIDNWDKIVPVFEVNASADLHENEEEALCQ